MNKSDVQKILKNVEVACQKKGARFTVPRRLVLEIIAQSEKPLGAYDILAELGKGLDNPKPPTAYRAIEFLLDQGVIHRIESMNAYVLCVSDHRHAGSQFMICDQCGNVTETHVCDLPQPLADKTKKAEFQLSSWNVELHGTCKKCS